LLFNNRNAEAAVLPLTRFMGMGYSFISLYLGFVKEEMRIMKR